MRELRIHGRGGQGAVVASKVLAAALFREGKSVQSFPAFGVERRGAPVTAFLRVSEGPILLRCEITEPDDCVILDPTLMKAIDVTQGLKPGGSILINTDRPPEAYADLATRFRVALVDASAIAARTRPGLQDPADREHRDPGGLLGRLRHGGASSRSAPPSPRRSASRPTQNVEAARAAAKAVVKIGNAEVQHA